jgi:hypothetical protein
MTREEVLTPGVAVHQLHGGLWHRQQKRGKYAQAKSGGQALRHTHTFSENSPIERSKILKV